MDYATVKIFLEDAKSNPSDLKLLYNDETYKELVSVSIKDGLERFEEIKLYEKAIIFRITSKIITTVYEATALHLAVLKNRVDVVSWLINHKNESFLKKTCDFLIVEHFTLYHAREVHSNPFDINTTIDWELIPGASRNSHRMETITAESLAKYLQNDCLKLFDPNPSKIFQIA